MSYEDHQQRVTLYLPRGLYNALILAASDADESVRASIIQRLASSLIVSQAAARSGLAGDEGGAAALPSDPTT